MTLVPRVAATSVVPAAIRVLPGSAVASLASTPFEGIVERAPLNNDESAFHYEDFVSDRQAAERRVTERRRPRPNISGMFLASSESFAAAFSVGEKATTKRNVAEIPSPLSLKLGIENYQTNAAVFDDEPQRGDKLSMRL